MKRITITILVLILLLLAIQAPLMAQSFTAGQTGATCMTDDDGVADPNDPGGGAE